jgi:hypothetical protein
LPWIVCALATFASTEALAQVTDTELAARRTLIDQASAARAANNPQQALDLAQRAGRIQMTPSLRMFIAETLAAMGNHAEAMGAADRCAQEADRDTAASNRAQILASCRAVATNARTHVGYVTVTARGCVADDPHQRHDSQRGARGSSLRGQRGSGALADGGFDVVDGSIDDTGIGDTGIGDTGIGDTGIGDTGVSPTCVACPVENVCSGSTCESVGTPVAIAPAAHAIVAARFPRILFSASATSDRTRVDFCRDPACAMIDGSATVMHATGAASASFVPMFDPFSDGRRRFWRVVAGNVRGFAQRGTTPRAIHRTGPGSTRASLQGWVAGYAQDFNNDGSSDLAASSGGSIDRFRTQPGGWYVFAGQASGASLVSPSPTTAGGVSIMPLHPPPGAPFGLRSYGDVNGDGFTDCSWSAHTGLESGTTIGVRGGIELFHGGPAPLTASAARFYSAGDHDYHVEAAAIGDLDDDGLLDLVAAGRRNTRIYVFSQTAAQSLTFATTPRYALTRPSVTNGPWAASMDALGDVNNDGLADFIVSASGAGAGAAIVYLGRPSMAPREVSIDVPGADRRTALAYNNSVAGLTDFNGDGTYEFALGVPNAGQTANNTGYVYIFGWDAGTSTFVVRQRVDISTYVSGGAADIFFGMGMR